MTKVPWLCVCVINRAGWEMLHRWSGQKHGLGYMPPQTHTSGSLPHLLLLESHCSVWLLNLQSVSFVMHVILKQCPLVEVSLQPLSMFLCSHSRGRFILWRNAFGHRMKTFGLNLAVVWLHCSSVRGRGGMFSCWTCRCSLANFNLPVQRVLGQNVTL